MCQEWVALAAELLHTIEWTILAVLILIGIRLFIDS